MVRENRQNDMLRPMKLSPGYIKNVPASILIEQGDTRLITTGNWENRVARFLKNSGKGWINAEYSMLPGATGLQRNPRERMRVNNRNIEIQRFIGRALRNTFDLNTIDGITLFIDCDVIQADGSTRCAAINSAMAVLVMLLKHLVFENKIPNLPQIEYISAVSIGVTGDEILVDLNYEEDAQADADINIVTSETKKIVEIQAFAEEKPIDERIFKKVIDIGIQRNLEIIQTLKSIG